MDGKEQAGRPEPGRRARKAAFYKHRPAWSMGGDFDCPHGQVFLYDRDRYWHHQLREFEVASAQAETQGIGSDRRLLCLRLPVIADSRLRISFYDKPPVNKDEDWLGIFTFGLWVPSRQLAIESGNRRIFPLHARGRFAARWQYADDYHQLQLWRRPRPVRLRPQQIK